MHDNPYDLIENAIFVHGRYPSGGAGPDGPAGIRRAIPGLVENQLNVRILDTPQFWPDGSSIVFYGADKNLTGLFEMMLIDSDVALINSSVEGASSFAFSPDGSRLAYMEYDREVGEVRLVLEEFTAREITILGTLPIPKGSGSSVPETANLSWSADGEYLVFDFGRDRSDHAIYLAHADGTELIKIADSAYAASISADGKCLAYISEDQVFLMDLTGVSSGSTTSDPVLLAKLPTGRGIPDFKQDRLQWGVE
jgi:Tol biopolymer transport system component